MPKAFLVKKARCCRCTVSKAADNERRYLPSTSENFGAGGKPLAGSFPTGQTKIRFNVTCESKNFERLMYESRQRPVCDSETSISIRSSEKTENKFEEEEDEARSRISVLTSGDVTACVSPIPPSLPDFSGSADVVKSGTDSTWNRYSLFPLSSTPKILAIDASLQTTMTSSRSNASTFGKRLQFQTLYFLKSVTLLSMLRTPNQS